MDRGAFRPRISWNAVALAAFQAAAAAFAGGQSPVAGMPSFHYHGGGRHHSPHQRRRLRIAARSAADEHRVARKRR